MGKCSAATELQKQDALIKVLDEKKKKLSSKTRENNKALDTAILELRKMVNSDNVDLFSKGTEDDTEE